MEREPPIPRAVLDNEAVEMPVPAGRPDIVVDPFNFEPDVRDEGYCYHRFPMGVLGQVDANRIMTDTLSD